MSGRRQVRYRDMTEIDRIAANLGIDSNPVFYETYADELERRDGNNPHAVRNIIDARARARALRRGGAR